MIDIAALFFLTLVIALTLLSSAFRCIRNSCTNGTGTYIMDDEGY